jgi:hypothetical protein
MMGTWIGIDGEEIPVTDSTKCYIISCWVCGTLREVTRANVITCGIRCRVWAHRHPGRLDELMKERSDGDDFRWLRWITKKPREKREYVFLHARWAAAWKLRPDLAQRAADGEWRSEEEAEINVFDPVLREYRKLWFEEWDTKSEAEKDQWLREQEQLMRKVKTT